jgi:hypothetical protein
MPTAARGSRSALSRFRPAAGQPRRRSTNAWIGTSACSTPISPVGMGSNWTFGRVMPIQWRWHGSSASVMHSTRALPNALPTCVLPQPREMAHRNRGTSRSMDADSIVTNPHTCPTTESSRALSCIVIRCSRENPNRAYAISRHDRLLSCRGAEHDCYRCCAGSSSRQASG